MALEDVEQSLSICIKKSFCKREIYHRHYVISGYHSNELSSITRVMSLERVVSKEQVRRHMLQCIVLILSDCIDVDVCSVVYRISETVCHSLFVRVIRWEWRLTSASTDSSITGRTGKECGRKQGKLIVRKLIYQTKEIFR
jgi:hypothetical protein